MATSTLRCFGIRSFDSAVAIGRAVEDLVGVVEITVEVFTRRIRVTYGPPTSLGEVRQALDEAGFPCAAVLTGDRRRVLAGADSKAPGPYDPA